MRDLYISGIKWKAGSPRKGESLGGKSPILMAFPGADIRVIGEEGMRPTPYRETEHYKLTRQFLESPERMAELLCEEEEP